MLLEAEKIVLIMWEIKKIDGYRRQYKISLPKWAVGIETV